MTPDDDHSSTSRTASRAGRAGSLRVLSLVAAAWVLSLGADLLLHAGLLARLYVEPSPFLLPAEEAFRRIPLGYLGFFALAAAVYWLLRRLDVRGAMAGLRVGLAAGAPVWGALCLGLYSISSARLELLAGWWIGQTAELGLAAAVLGAGIGGSSLKRIWSFVAGGVVICLLATIAMQALGFSPAMKVAR